MKAVFFFWAILTSVSLCAQTKSIYGLFKKSDGSKINGTGTARGYENQIDIVHYSGGSDNSAIIEIEVPTGAYVADFRNLMNSASATTQPKVITKPTIASKPVLTAPNTITQDIGIKPNRTITSTQLAPTSLARMDISVIESGANNYGSYIKNKIIMEDIKVESCTDDAATGKTKIKLKALRIGWVYYSYEITSGKVSSVNKSGWNTVTSSSWTSF